MERRKFLTWLGLAPLAFAAAKYLPAPRYFMGVDPAFGPDATVVNTIAVDWRACRAYTIGQRVIISGNPRWNGEYRVVSAGTSGPNTSSFNEGTLSMEKI